MRTAFVDTLLELAATDRRIFLLTADLGWSVLEKFATRYPDRFLNVGVAEQNMLGVATGLALAGYTPFVYSIATFSSMRCYEQIRNGPVLHRLPVRVVGIGGGYAYGHAGPTHHALEDLAITRVQPGLTVLAPADRPQARAAILNTADHRGPIYFRISKDKREAIPGLDGRFELGRPELVCEGRDLLLISTGDIAHEAVRAAQILNSEGVSTAMAVLAHLGFEPSPELCELLGSYRRVATLEEGYAAGGLGSLVAEAIAREGLACRLSIHGIRQNFPDVSGSTTYMRGRNELNAEQLAAQFLRDIKQRRRAA